MVLFKPKYEGELQLKNIQKKPPFTLMSLVYHIHATNSKDAMMALGYVHADRLWQMELMRRIAPGRLSEILVQ
jgi:penicillin amidase